MSRGGKNLSRCKYCGAPIRWAPTRYGARMAVSDSSDPKGSIIFDDRFAVALGPQEAALERERGSLLFLAHAATCPAAKRSSTSSRMPESVRRQVEALKEARRGHKR
ncbi:hypothetical protein [Corynebacterium glucuronolyticum]|nr:hypothetical protein [Corynebacterium glucuronolyticum]WKD63029.1 hypothetical protein CGLUCO_03770 [Corynebacterium glucuronolyticum DSM 44120]SMB85744.1 hypothetical protein SAMN05660745_01525 [Corynebacterium glucuronolyticum]